MKDLNEMPNLERALACVKQAEREVEKSYIANSSLSGSILAWDSELARHYLRITILLIKEGVEHEERERRHI